MSANSSFSSSSILSLHPPPPPPSSLLNSSSVLNYKCFEVTVGSHIFAALSCTYIFFFLPLCIYILHLGLQRRRRRRFVSSATTSSSDIFTYNIVAMEMIGVLGCCFYCSGVYAYKLRIKLVGLYIFNIVTPGQMFFHILTCLERYLAVIHPIVYLGLKKANGVRLRNISVGFAWVLSLGSVGLTAMYSPNFPTIPFAILLIFSVIVTSFFSLSVLLALIRPGPGEGGGDRDRVGHSKRRAFHTIGTITGTLLLRFGGQLLCLLVNVSAPLSDRDSCVVLLSGLWFCMPSSYVLPLLFLHRARKLPCFRYDTESGQGSE